MWGSMFIRVSGIVNESVVDGPGLRLVIFFQGCLHNCPNCHNPDTHSLLGGQEFQEKELINIIDKARLIRGVTFSGGEPFLQAYKLLNLASYIKNNKKYNLLIYTGYCYEQLLKLGEKDISILKLLQFTDWIIDGKYIKSERDLQLAYRGSRNQKIIDVQESLLKRKIINADFSLKI